jgi:hypothetical protein
MAEFLPNEQPILSLLSRDLWEFNGDMKMKILVAAVVAGCVLGCAALKETSTSTKSGKICSCSNTEIRLQTGINEWYIIKRTPTTHVTSGTCSTDSMATVEFSSPDAQRKEGPWRCQTPTSTSKPPSR